MDDPLEQRCATLRAIIIARSSIERQGSAHRDGWVRQLQLLETTMAPPPSAIGEIPSVIEVRRTRAAVPPNPLRLVPGGRPDAARSADA